MTQFPFCDRILAIFGHNIKQAQAWPDPRLGSKELDGLAEVLGIFKDVREMKVRPKDDFLRQHVYNKGWLTQRRSRQR